MFERAEARAARLGQARVRARVAEIAGRGVPAGVRVEASGSEVAVSGRGLRRRLVTEAALRWWAS